MNITEYSYKGHNKIYYNTYTLIDWRQNYNASEHLLKAMSMRVPLIAPPTSSATA